MLKLKYSLLALAVFMTAGFVLSGNAHADPVCGTLEECRSLRTYIQKELEEQDSQAIRAFLLSQLTEVDARIEELSGKSPDPEKRTTNTGHVFTRDRSHAALNEAWRDPSGLIWGDTVKNTDGAVDSMDHDDATHYCTSMGARLPSEDEFIRLREWMGARFGTAGNRYIEGYSAQVLPNLSGYWFWLTSDIPYARGFDGSNGGIGYAFNNSYYAVRCVVVR